MAKKTTIKVSKGTVDRINEIKVHPRQSCEEVIEKLVEFFKKSGKNKIGKGNLWVAFFLLVLLLAQKTN